MIDDGAAVLDIGGESTRPGASPVDALEELRRVIPAIQALAHLDTVLSIDTYKPEVAREAIAAGACLVNDVTGLRNAAMYDVLRETGAAVCVMHMLGEPRTMQRDPTYTHVVDDVRESLRGATERCLEHGIGHDRILVDPGIGFGKTLAHNLELLRRLERIAQLGFPVLVGVSRKSTIGMLTGRVVGERKAGSLAAAVLAIERGARVIRSHDVAETVDALAVATAILEDGKDRNEQ
jgi:dihydropteroate synthase